MVQPHGARIGGRGLILIGPHASLRAHALLHERAGCARSSDSNLLDGYRAAFSLSYIALMAAMSPGL